MYRIVLLAAAVAVSAPAFAENRSSGNVSEILTLPNGMEIVTPKTEDFMRTGRIGAWGGRVHERAGETVNNQYNAGERATGSYVNSGGISGLRYSGKAEAGKTSAVLSLVDAWDQRPTEGFKVTVRGRDEDGTWGTLGTYEIGGREASGTIHNLRVKLSNAGQRFVAYFEQKSRKLRSGDIFAVGHGVCKRKA
ncbi:MAG: hypothetical protein QM699_05910 [Amaricoccus sp.]|uniref:hypothetical protein n=1 Tax=Amaricoccus sp. TaxID=1872485 RepID=UPI0039E68CAA